MAYGDALNVLGDPTRRAVLEAVAGGPRSVTEIASKLPVSRPAVSQHLRALSDAGLVSFRAEGTKRLYSVDPKGFARLHDYVDRFWNVALANYKQVAETKE